MTSCVSSIPRNSYHNSSAKAQP